MKKITLLVLVAIFSIQAFATYNNIRLLDLPLAINIKTDRVIL